MDAWLGSPLMRTLSWLTAAAYINALFRAIIEDFIAAFVVFRD
jgi:hypothetical protein